MTKAVSKVAVTSLKTPFEKVEEFHELGGQAVFSPDATLARPDIKSVRFREDFKIEEFIEGIEALTRSDSLTAKRAIELLRQAKAKLNELQEHDLDINYVEYADSLADLIYITFGTGHYYNMNMTAIFDEVHDKNLTRFPATKEELALTLEKAKAEGVEVTHFFNEKYQRYAVIRVDSGKVYKSACHTLPDLKPILNL